AVVEWDCPAKRTVTRMPASAQPHTGAGAPRCRIMWSEKIAGSRSSADAAAASSSINKEARERSRRVIGGYRVTCYTKSAAEVGDNEPSDTPYDNSKDLQQRPHQHGR